MDLETYKSRRGQQVSQETLRTSLSCLKNLEQFIGGGEVTVDDVEEWVDHLLERFDEGEIKASTIKQYVRVVDSYFEIVKGKHDQLESIKNYLPKDDVDHGEYLDRDEIEEIFNSCYKAQTRLMLKLMYYYARRPREITLLNEEDIDLDEGTITYNILKKSNGDLSTIRVDGRTYEVMRATFEIHDEVREELERVVEYNSGWTQTITIDGEEKEVTPMFTTRNGRVSYSSVRKRVKRVIDMCEIERNITPKSMRHSRATHLDWQGNDPEIIARHQLLHAPNTDTIAGYIHEKDEEQVREVMD